MGLNIHEDLNAWFRWQESRDRLRWAKKKVKSLGGVQSGQATLTGFLHTRGKEPEVLVILESASPTSLSALLSPVKYIENPVAVWSPMSLESSLPGEGWEVRPLEGMPVLAQLRIVLSAGHYLPFGKVAYELALAQGAEYIVVQHGLMTPYAPPLPAYSTLFAFSQKDADFWISGRQSIPSEVVGSQLFFEAAQKSKVASSEIGNEIIFLGQMHGAELPRLSFARSSYDFCQKNGAVYRPHPSEKDKLSTLTHKLWAKQGISIDSGQTLLNQLNNPVVSIFSTGVLEAAIRGIPSWVYHSNPPAWLKEFWDRYGMNQWGSAPTPAPVQPAIEPALAIAQKIAHRLEN